MNLQSCDNIVGKISCISVENFMTYENVELHAGEYLNIILGPNGSGKSTIVAAIVLGMGGSPKLLSRSSNIKDFIKNGKDTAWIKIEIYKNVKREKIKFERFISQERNNIWKIDDKQISEKQYLTEVSAFNIQVDNLCQFLPQDRVQDFTKMNPREILVNTLKSVCKEEMFETFNKLKEMRKSQLQSNKSVAENQKKLVEAEKKFETLKEAVELIKTRKKLIQETEMCENKKIWIASQETKDMVKEIENDLDQHQTFVERDKGKFDDLKNQEEQLLNLLRENETNKTNEDRKLKMLLEKKEKEKNLRKQLISELAVKLHDVESKKKDESEREKRIGNAKTILKGYIQDLKNEQQYCGSSEEQKEKKRLFENERGKVQAEKDKLMDYRLDINRQLDEYQPQLQYVKKKLNDLESVSTRRLNMIRQSNEDVYKSCVWLRQNRHLFQGHIYEPMLLELNVKNHENAKYLENTVAYRDLIAFTCECKSDVDLLTRKVRNEQNLKINVIYSESADVCQYKAKVPINQYTKYGFKSYLIDMLEGPAPILNYLCLAYRIHEVLIGDETVDEYSDDLPNNIRLFFGGNFKYSIVVSKYSKKKSSLRELIKSKNLFCMNVDANELNKLNEKLKEITRKTDALKNQRTNIETELLKYDEQIKGIYENKKKFEARLTKIRQLTEEMNAQMRKIKRIENETIDLKQEIIAFNEFKKGIMEQLSESYKKRVNYVRENIDYKIKIEDYVHFIQDLKQQHVNLRSEIRTASEALQNSEALLETIKVKYEEAKRSYRKKIEELKKVFDGKLPSDKDFPYTRKFSRIPNTIAEINERINEIQSRIDCMGEENAHVIQEYEAVKATVQYLTQSITNATGDEKQIEMRMKEMHDKWFPKINQILQIINENFSKFMSSMGYAGEIQLLHNHERDYEEYGVKILVQYRDNSRLQPLDQFIQSGGERAVAIAVYTLSLQHITKVPFRCVDEINQGMDERNEKKIFNMIVEETSHLGKAQYFFVTPKFAPYFNYNNLIRVHVVFNGKYVSNKL